MAALKRKHIRVARMLLWLVSGSQGGSIPVVRLEPGGKTFALSLKRGRYVIGGTYTATHK
jgi:hypothetical protein